MSISPQSAIKQLREAFPEKYSALTDEEVYYFARTKYPKANIDDWAESGYIPQKPIQPEDAYLNKTDENSFLDNFSLWGTDNDSSFLSQLTYSRSLQGMANDFIRGKPKFTLERQPAIWEEMVAGILSYTQPLDALTLLAGGGLLTKAAGKVGALKGASGYLTKQVLKAAPKANASNVQTAINGILASELAYVPYEGAKANMFARTMHMRDPGNFPEPMSSEDITKETFAGIVHGGIMGVLGGATRPFLAAKHLKQLNRIDQLELEKTLKGQKAKELFSLKNKVKYTGNLGQYASEVVGLTAGDIAGTAVAYGQLKSAEEMFTSLVTMGGFAGATRLAALGTSKYIMEPVTRANEQYRIDYAKKIKQQEVDENVVQNMYNQSKNKENTAAESKATNDASNAAFPDAGKAREAFESSAEYKIFKEIEEEVKVFKKNRNTLGSDPKKVKEFYEGKGLLFAKVRNYLDNSGMKDKFDDVNNLDDWLSRGNEEATKSLNQIPGEIDSRITTKRQVLKDDYNVETISIFDENSKTYKEVNIGEATKLMKGKDSIEQRENLEIELDRVLEQKSKSENKVSQQSFDKAENEYFSLNKDENSFLEKQKKIESIAPEKRTKLDDTDYQINSIILKANKIIKNKLSKKNNLPSDNFNLQAVQTWLTYELPSMKRARGKQRVSLELTTIEKYAKEIISFVEQVNKEHPGVKLTKLRKDIFIEFGGKIKDGSSLVSFLKFMDMKGILSPELKGLHNDLFAKAAPLAALKPKIGLQTSEVKGGGGLDIDTGKTGSRKVIAWSSARNAGRTLKKVINNIIKLVDNEDNQVSGIPGVDKSRTNAGDYRQFFKLIFFGKKLEKGKFVENIAISDVTLKALSVQLFGKGMTGKTFRKSFSSWVADAYPSKNVGELSVESQLVDFLGLSHAPAKADVAKAYINQFKLNKKTGLPDTKYVEMFQKLQNEFQNLIFDKITTKDLLKMKNKQLKKYNLTEGAGLTFKSTPSIYSLKKGFEAIAELSKTADKKGYINFDNKLKIHKDVLEAMFRTMSEGSSRITEQFGKVVTGGEPTTGVQFSQTSGLGKKALDNLYEKANIIKYAENLENPDIKLKQQPKDIFKKEALSFNSSDNKKSGVAKVKILLAGSGNKEITRKNLGNKEYESNLKDILIQAKVLTKLEINKMKKISLQDDVIDSGVLQKLTEILDCSN